MDLSPQIKAVHQRVTHLRQRVTEAWLQPPEIVDDAFDELCGVLEELGTDQEELQRQNPSAAGHASDSETGAAALPRFV